MDRSVVVSLAELASSGLCAHVHLSADRTPEARPQESRRGWTALSTERCHPGMGIGSGEKAGAQAASQFVALPRARVGCQLSRGGRRGTLHQRGNSERGQVEGDTGPGHSGSTAGGQLLERALLRGLTGSPGGRLPTAGGAPHLSYDEDECMVPTAFSPPSCPVPLFLSLGVLHKPVLF